MLIFKRLTSVRWLLAAGGALRTLLIGFSIWQDNVGQQCMYGCL
jgi:hypothetical protein